MAPPALPPVYPITPEQLRGEALEVWARALLEGGATLLQFRRKSGPDGEKLEDLRCLVEAARPFGARVVVDDRVDLCLLAGAAGVHLGQRDLPPGEARILLGREAWIGFSTHTLEQFEEALDLPVDYLALGPVFPTATKEGADPVVPPLVQREVLRRSPLPVVAIGGVTARKAPELWRRGFASVAAISAFAADPGGALAEFKAAAHEAGLPFALG